VNPPLQRHLLSQTPLDAATASALLAAARALKESGEAEAPLRGKNIAMMCGSDSSDARLFAEAAARLGARVARIEPAPAWLRGESQPGADTARLLEHLYDAVDCEALPPGFARHLQEQVGVPVYDGLARADHPIFGLLGALEPPGQASTAADRCLLLQAALVSTLL
jgi:ornithine carbamoyltransferase